MRCLRSVSDREEWHRLRHDLRVEAIHRLGGVLPHRGLTYEELVDLLYPILDDPTYSQLIDEAGQGELTDPSTIRKMLGAIEHQLAPSRFSIQVTNDDAKLVTVDGVDLFCDVADRSVSFQLQLGVYEPHITALFKRICKPGMTVVDVGANVGYYALLASDLVGPEGRVIAVEPSSENCRLLLSSMRLNQRTNIVLFPVACDAQPGWAYYSKHIGSNGGFVEDEDLLSHPGVVVPTFRLQDLVDGPVDLLKLDVEGAEDRVVSGAHDLIEKYRPIIITEFSQEMLRRNSKATALSYLNYFEQLGYRLAVIERSSEELKRYDTSHALLEEWKDPYQIEDLLLTPEESEVLSS
jgi:FkbM family methyltransferase